MACLTEAPRAISQADHTTPSVAEPPPTRAAVGRPALPSVVGAAVTGLGGSEADLRDRGSDLMPQRGRGGWTQSREGWREVGGSGGLLPSERPAGGSISQDTSGERAARLPAGTGLEWAPGFPGPHPDRCPNAWLSHSPASSVTWGWLVFSAPPRRGPETGPQKARQPREWSPPPPGTRGSVWRVPSLGAPCSSSGPSSIWGCGPRPGLTVCVPRGTAPCTTPWTTEAARAPSAPWTTTTPTSSWWSQGPPGKATGPRSCGCGWRSISRSRGQVTGVSLPGGRGRGGARGGPRGRGRGGRSTGEGLPAGEGGLPGTPWWGSQGWSGLKDHQLGPGRAFQPPNMPEC